MSVGYLVLYAALGVVALWLVAELLLQSRAPLHWRAVALAGFLLVPVGMSLSSVPVIGAGAAGFALGQVMVTLSVKRGYTSGWSLRRADGELPGALAKVPLLSAATGGEDPAAEAVAVAKVGEVGPVEEPSAEEPAAAAPYAFEQVGFEQAAFEPAPFEQTPFEPAPFDGSAYDYRQQAAYQPEPLAEDSVYAGAYYQPQPEQQQYYAAADEYGHQAPVGGYEQQYQPQYQDPYAQSGYYEQGWQPQEDWQQQPAIPQQPAPGHDQQQPNWNYQQQP
ncbi:hypothetical protein ACIRBX_10725 [Kitasatospora sp. NPDC096147]|uniref:hypothetical protein n=1 Tax=Kitasatospora sp. NPDC096147 TaxID=3364093 RepID=UPI003821EB2C